MSARNSEASLDEAAVVLSVYLEPVVEGRRVLFVGDASVEAIARLSRTARAVRVLDTGARRERPRAGREVKVTPYRPGPLGFSPESYDVIVVPDLSALGDEIAERLDDFVRIAGDVGVLVTGIASSDEILDYEALWDVLARRFDVVRMLGMAPFVGQAVAELGETPDVEVVVDGSLVERIARPSRFVALCAQSDLLIDPFVLVQTDAVPSSDAETELLRRENEVLLDQLERFEAVLVEQREEVVLARDEAQRLRHALEEETNERDQLDADRRKATREAEVARSRVAELENELRKTRKAVEEAADRGELAALEERLSEQAERLRELSSEVERRGAMVRELVEENRELAQRHGHEVDPRVLDRALRAEAERAQLAFEVDELHARLAELSTGGAESHRTHDAELVGRERGLRARVAELEEQHAMAEARLQLAESDLDAARDRERRLIADQERLREELELEIVRSHGPKGSSGDAERQLAELRASERQLAERVGQLTGQLLVAREKELDARAQRDLARGENLALVAQVSALETQIEQARGRLLAQLGAALAGAVFSRTVEPGATSVESALTELVEVVDGLRGERDGLRLRLDAVERGRASGGTSVAPDARVLDDLDRYRSEVEALREENSALSLELADLRDHGRRESERAADLVSAVAARDALVTRLQMDLAEAEQAGRVLRDRAQHLASEGERLREAVLNGVSAVDAREALERRIAELERELADARRARESRHAELDGARTELANRVASLEIELADARARAAAADHARELDARALAETRGILERLRLESERAAGSGHGRPGFEATHGGEERGGREEVDTFERDTVIRSLTAQLEEKNDRIRSLERRISGSTPPPPGSDEALRRELLEQKERVMRLGEELGLEREARRVAEERSLQLAALATAESDLRDLERQLGLRDRDLEQERQRAVELERDVRLLRDAFFEARGNLEALFGTASASGDPELAERIGALLTLVTRF
ncbi:MAG: hypothetical protein U0230_06795 [Polyangiales bacterium]